MSKKVVCSQLVRRQTADSQYSHFEGTWETLEDMMHSNFTMAQPGYREGVILISVNPKGFFSGVVSLDSATKLTPKFEARADGEHPFLSVTADGPKMQAKRVDIVLYRHDVLGDEASSDAEWEIVSINARTTDEPEPMHPVTMMRNFLELPGGTKAIYSAEEFAKSIFHWLTKYTMKTP